MGTTDGPNLRQLLQLVASRDEFALSEALAIAYPEFHADQATALARFRSFRERINSLAADTGLEFKLATDSGRGVPAKHRAWFTGPDLAAAGARDDGKHTLEPAHKREIMEHLAAAYWREGAREWDVDRLEAWFDELLLACPRIASAYAGKERAILNLNPAVGVNHRLHR